jgi:hypothetical protein
MREFAASIVSIYITLGLIVVVGHFERRIPSAAKAAIDFAQLTARLKPRPFKTNSN